MRAKNCVNRFSVGISERKRRFGNCRFRWDLGLQDGEWINLVRRRDVSKNCRQFLDWLKNY
jgi:hypothetical protein